LPYFISLKNDSTFVGYLANGLDLKSLLGLPGIEKSKQDTLRFMAIEEFLDIFVSYSSFGFLAIKMTFCKANFTQT
jgi:hypothetical protein